MFERLSNPPKNQSFFLFGPRQTGKTSLLRTTFPTEQTLVYNLLLSSEYLRLSANPSLFREEVVSRNPKVTHIIIDEIQRIPELLNEIHNILENPDPPFFAITGSSARKLKRSNANMLGGRAWTLKLHPLTHIELNECFNLQRALALGTLPKICTLNNADATQLLRSYVETYLKEEIEAEALVRATGTFIRFLFQAGYESGNILNYATIARDVGTSSVTVKQYFQILEDTLIGRFLPAFAKSTRKRLASHPKFYFFDNGVQRALSKKLTVPLEPKTKEFGEAFELFIINECWRLNDYKNLDREFSFYRSEHGAEVDLIIEFPNGETLAVEIKSSSNPIAADFRSGLESFRSVCPKAKMICVCNAPHPRKVDETSILPWREFFKEYF